MLPPSQVKTGFKTLPPPFSSFSALGPWQLESPTTTLRTSHYKRPTTVPQLHTAPDSSSSATCPTGDHWRSNLFPLPVLHYSISGPKLSGSHLYWVPRTGLRIPEARLPPSCENQLAPIRKTKADYCASWLRDLTLGQPFLSDVSGQKCRIFSLPDLKPHARSRAPQGAGGSLAQSASRDSTLSPNILAPSATPLACLGPT